MPVPEAAAPAPIREHEIGQMHAQGGPKQQQACESVAGAVFSSYKRPSEYQAYRTGTPERPVSINSMPILVGAAMIAAAILLSTLVDALGTRYIGLESSSDDTAWLIDRLTGSVYRCEASERGKAMCNSDVATGSIAHRAKP